MASVTRRTQSAQSARTERRRENLAKLRVALEEMLAEGESFTEISVERLVVRAGVSRSTFYVHFTDKGQVLAEVSADLVEQLLGAGRGWWGRDAPADRETLRDRVRVIVDVYRPRAELMRAVIETSAHDTGVRQTFRALTDRYVDELARHIATGQRDGTVAADLPVRGTAQMLTWMAERALDRMLRGADDAEAEAVVDAFTTLVWNALYRV